MILIFLFTQALSLDFKESKFFKDRACYKIIDGYLKEHEEGLVPIFQAFEAEVDPSKIFLRLKFDLYKLCMNNLEDEKAHKIIRESQLFNWKAYEDVLEKFTVRDYMRLKKFEVTDEMEELDLQILEEERLFQDLEKQEDFSGRKLRRPKIVSSDEYDEIEL